MSRTVQQPYWLTQEWMAHHFDYDPEQGYLKYPEGHPTRAGWKAGKYNKQGHFVIKVKGKTYSLRKLVYLMFTGIYPQRVFNTNREDPYSTRIEDLALEPSGKV